MKPRQPDFNQLLRVLQCQVPDRDVLFEFILNKDIFAHATGHRVDETDRLNYKRHVVQAYAVLGYDCATCAVSDMAFPIKQRTAAASYSLNEISTIHDRASFDAYEWPDPKAFSTQVYATLATEVPQGMKLMPGSPNGVLENAMNLIGFDNLCMMLYDDEQLVGDIFYEIGTRIKELYSIALTFSVTGLLMLNDDWGFNSQTMLSPDMMRKYVFPWYKEYVAMAHAAGRPAVLHSCGNYSQIIGDMLDIGFDGRHSYEDKITPVEDAIPQFAGKMAVLGGIDVDFLCRATPEKIKERARNLLAMGRQYGGYALGSGNSIPSYCPTENYLAMISVIDEA